MNKIKNRQSLFRSIDEQRNILMGQTGTKQSAIRNAKLAILETKHMYFLDQYESKKHHKEVKK